MIKSLYTKSLLKYKNIHHNKSAIIFATGPSIEQYTKFTESEQCIKIGLNRIYNYPDILKELDYYYYGSHYYIDKEHKNKIDQICNTYDFITFASAYENGKSHEIINRGNITPQRAIELGSIPFENNLSEFTNDIENYSTLGHSIVFPPLQHILYMGVNKIYLVGCDGGFWHGNSESEELLYWWRKFKEFKDTFFPDVKIISINPVSLKGWFTDEIIK